MRIAAFFVCRRTPAIRRSDAMADCLCPSLRDSADNLSWMTSAIREATISQFVSLIPTWNSEFPARSMTSVSSAPVPDTEASYWDEQIPSDWRSAPVLVEPDDGKVYSGYQFRIDAFVDDRDLLDGWSENPRVNGVEPFRRFRWRMPAMWKTWRCLSTDVAPSADRHRGSHRGRRNARSPIGANGLCGSLWYQ